MERVTLEAELREQAGSRGAKRLRRAGRVPAVLYGHEIDTLLLTVDGRTVDRMITHEGFHGLIDLKIKGKAEASKRSGPLLVLLKAYQADIVTRELIHLDFYKVDLEEKVTVRVPVHVEGVAPGVKEGGILELSRRELEVRCLPTAIPEAIVVDVSGLKIGESIHIQDLTMSAGVEVTTEINFAVVSVAAPTKEVEVAPAAPPVEGVPEGEAPAEGGAAKKEEAADKKEKGEG